MIMNDHFIYVILAAIAVNNFLYHCNDKDEGNCYTHGDVNDYDNESVTLRSRCVQGLPIFITLRFTNIFSDEK
jgi:hypothetical protein